MAETIWGVPPVPESGTSTSRGRDVLCLPIAGRTDRAIGNALFIGTRTVEGHIARIFGKLGVHTRAAAISAALGAGLVALPIQPAAYPEFRAIQDETTFPPPQTGRPSYPSP